MDHHGGILMREDVVLCTKASRPLLTVIVPAVDDYRTVFEAIRAVEDQTAFDRLELLLVIPSLTGFAAPADFASRHPRARLIESGRRTQLHEARAIGIREALADWVFLLEDHCLPFPNCMENLLNRIGEETWEVVGPAIVCGNRRSVFGKAANLLTYGEWMGCSEAGERRYVTGYSSAWRRKALLQFGPVLELELAIPSRLQERLRARGKRLFFEPAAVMVHWEASWLGDIVRILFRQGRGMGFVRRGTSPFADRMLATVLIPLLVAHRTLRGLLAWRREPAAPLQVLAVLPLLALTWSAGELIGYWTRDGEAALTGVAEVERRRQPFIDMVGEPLRRPWAAPDDHCQP